jgi:prevent-host-death family protein
MQVNMLEAKNQLSRLVKAALSGEEVIIASHGKPQVRLVPCKDTEGLRGFGLLAEPFGRNAGASTDDAFTEETEQEVRHLFEA